MKYALIKLNREEGPVFVETKDVTEEEKNNILVFALPTGEAKNGAYKLITLNRNFYVSYIELDKNNNGNAAVIGIDISGEKLNINPFGLFDILKEMVANKAIQEIDLDKISNDQFRSPYSTQFKGGEYIMTSMLLLERLIVVGDHSEIIKFLATLYEATPIQSIPYLSCVSLVNSITETINIQGIELTEEVYNQLDEARTDSTIVILDELEAFGTTSSPFTEEVAELYMKGDFDASRKKVEEFIQLMSGDEIESATDFANSNGMNKADAKLLKRLQERTRELREMRKNSIYYKGVN